MHQAWFKELGQIVSTLLSKSLHANTEEKRKENRKRSKGKEEKFNLCRGTNSWALCQEYLLQICSINQATYGLSGGSDSKESAWNAETWVPFLGREDSLEKEMATHFSILVWRSPWTEEPGRLQSMYVVTKRQTELSDWTQHTQPSNLGSNLSEIISLLRVCEISHYCSWTRGGSVFRPWPGKGRTRKGSLCLKNNLTPTRIVQLQEVPTAFS